MNKVLKWSLVLCALSFVALFVGMMNDIQDETFIFALIGVMCVSLVGMIVGAILNKCGIGEPKEQPKNTFEQPQSEPAATAPIGQTETQPTQPTQPTTANGFKIDIKAVLVLIAIAVAVFFVFKSCDSGASGTNIKVIYVDENSVGFYPVCPKCDHVGDAHDVKISPGEDFDTYFFCDNRQCQHMYKVTVERDD